MKHTPININSRNVPLPIPLQLPRVPWSKKNTSSQAQKFKEKRTGRSDPKENQAGKLFGFTGHNARHQLPLETRLSDYIFPRTSQLRHESDVFGVLSGVQRIPLCNNASLHIPRVVPRPRLMEQSRIAPISSRDKPMNFHLSLNFVMGSASSLLFNATSFVFKNQVSGCDNNVSTSTEICRN